MLRTPPATARRRLNSIGGRLFLYDGTIAPSENLAVSGERVVTSWGGADEQLNKNGPCGAAERRRQQSARVKE
jgi:hypothetical protein